MIVDLMIYSGSMVKFLMIYEEFLVSQPEVVSCPSLIKVKCQVLAHFRDFFSPHLLICTLNKAFRGLPSIL